MIWLDSEIKLRAQAPAWRILKQSRQEILIAVLIFIKVIQLESCKWQVIPTTSD